MGAGETATRARTRPRTTRARRSPREDVFARLDARRDVDAADTARGPRVFVDGSAVAPGGDVGADGRRSPRAKRRRRHGAPASGGQGAATDAKGNFQDDADG